MVSGVILILSPEFISMLVPFLNLEAPATRAARAIPAGSAPALLGRARECASLEWAPICRYRMHPVQAEQAVQCKPRGHSPRSYY